MAFVTVFDQNWSILFSKNSTLEAALSFAVTVPIERKNATRVNFKQLHAAVGES